MADRDDWTDLRLFAAVAEEGTLRGATAAVGLSYSTLSRRLHALETRLGAKLFERGTHGFRLTEAGASLLGSVADARRAIDAGLRHLTGMHERMEGSLRVTLPDFVLIHLLLPAIVTFQTRYPAVDLEIETSYAAFDLDRQMADVAIRVTPFDMPPPAQLIGRKVAVSYADALRHGAARLADHEAIEGPR